MKWKCAFLLSFVALAAAQDAPKPAAAPAKAVSAPVAAAPVPLTAVRRVYMLSMAGGLDQYIANRLTNAHALEVVTDPQLADAVMTDNIGKQFELGMAQLYPPPEPPAAPDKKEKKDSETETPANGIPVSSNVPPVGAMTSWSHGKGNIFLVDVHAKQVLWSVYERPADNSSQELDRTALRVVKRLEKDVARRKKPE